MVFSCRCILNVVYGLQPAIAFKADPVSGVIGSDLGNVTVPARVSGSSPGPVLFDFRTGQTFSIYRFRLRMPASASCTGNHRLSISSNIITMCLYKPRFENLGQASLSNMVPGAKRCWMLVSGIRLRFQPVGPTGRRVEPTPRRDTGFKRNFFDLSRI